VGKSSLALAYVKLIPLARITRQEHFVDLLNEHSQLLSQLVDLLGAVQTFDAHNATFGFLYKEAETTNEQLDLLEKYLQSLAVATHPDRKIVEHLYGILEWESIQKQLKLRESIIQTLATRSHLQLQIRAFCCLPAPYCEIHLKNLILSN